SAAASKSSTRLRRVESVPQVRSSRAARPAASLISRASRKRSRSVMCSFPVPGAESPPPPTRRRGRNRATSCGDWVLVAGAVGQTLLSGLAGQSQTGVSGLLTSRPFHGLSQPRPRIRPEPVGGPGGDFKGGGRVRDRQPGEVTELNQFSGLRVGI